MSLFDEHQHRGQDGNHKPLPTLASVDVLVVSKEKCCLLCSPERCEGAPEALTSGRICQPGAHDRLCTLFGTMGGTRTIRLARCVRCSPRYETN